MRMVHNCYFVQGWSIRNVDVTTIIVKFGTLDCPIVVIGRGSTVYAVNGVPLFVPPSIQSHRGGLVVNKKELSHIPWVFGFHTV